MQWMRLIMMMVMMMIMVWNGSEEDGNVRS